MTKRKLQAIETKGIVFEAAVRLFKEKGYDNVSVNEICAEAGISVGGFYHHFRTKEDIVIESFYNIDKFMAHAASELSEVKCSIDHIVDYLGYFANYVNYQGMDFTCQLIKSEVSNARGFTTDMTRPIATNLERIVAEGQIKNEIRNDMTAGSIVNHILRYARGIALNWCVCRGSYDIGAEITDSARLFLTCFAPIK